MYLLTGREMQNRFCIPTPDWESPNPVGCVSKSSMPNPPFKYPFREAFKATTILETLSNYVVADQFAETPVAAIEKHFAFSQEEDFWKAVFGRPALDWNVTVDLKGMTLSTWVPRVPGLYHTPNARVFRESEKDDIEYISGRWTHQKPNAKSAAVLGGIGTLNLLPDAAGNRLVCLTSSGNTSAGIPVIISDPIWQKYSLSDGQQMDLQGARWRPLQQEWEQRFPYIAGIPRAALYFDDDTVVTLFNDFRTGGTTTHPFSILEYEVEDAVFYDYVYCAAHRHRGDYIDDHPGGFFGEYSSNNNRYGRYLIAADPTEPWFNAEFASGAELLRADAAGRTLLHVVEERVRKNYFSGYLLEEIIRLLSTHYPSAGELIRIGQYASISPARLPADKPAKMVHTLVEECLKKGKMELLVQCMAVEHPQILKAG